jgi:Raf kinase inhibitor-like YbhB/YbcL family protein
MKIKPAHALFALAVLAVVGFGGGGTSLAAGAFALSSTTFRDGSLLPKKVGDHTPGNANCVGDNVSPQLSWSGVPTGTRSFAFTMIDPEGRLGEGFVHWVAYGIPADVTSFAEGQISGTIANYVPGKSGKDVPTFGGPCTPPESPHHYTFLIVATDLDPADRRPG